MSLRVLMFGWELPPFNSGGLGTACEGLATALAGQAVETIFVLPYRLPIGPAPFRIIFAGPPLPAGGAFFSAYASGAEPAPAGSSRRPRTLLDEVRLYARRARRLAQREQFDIIHVHDWLAIPAGLAAKAASGKPLVVQIHATEFDRGGGLSVNQEVYQIERAGLQAADRVVAVSDWTKKMLVRHYGIAPEKIEVIHNGVRAEEYGHLPAALETLRGAGNKIVLFVGRITLQKGPDYFVRVAKRVLELEPHTYFVMAGSGDMAPQMMRLAAALHIADRFFFPGFLRGAELTRLYRAADLYILPSVSEPFGITPLEALQQGTPVLVSKQSGVAEVLSHALKTDFWDIDEMTNQIVSVLRHASLHQTLSEHGQREAKEATWQKAAQKLAKMYGCLVA